MSVKEGKVSFVGTHVPRNATSAVSQKKNLVCVKLKLLFQGDFIFNVKMYLDCTAKFDILQPHPLPPPRVAGSRGSSLFSPRCGTVPAFIRLQSEVKVTQPETYRAPPNLLWRSCHWFLDRHVGLWEYSLSAPWKQAHTQNSWRHPRM